MVRAVSIGDIRTDGNTQPRAAINSDLVAEYAELMQDGVDFPPPTVFYDGDQYWLADGFHRLEANKALASEVFARCNTVIDSIQCDVRPGTQQDAQWYSYSANKDHGQRRTNEDKHRAVDAALRHPKATRLSTRRIAEHCGVCHMTVQRRRDQISSSVTKLQMPGRTVTRRGSTYQLNTSNIGRPAQPTKVEPDKPAPLRDDQPTVTHAPPAGLAGCSPAEQSGPQSVSMPPSTTAPRWPATTAKARTSQPVLKQEPVSALGTAADHQASSESRHTPKESTRQRRTKVIRRLILEASKQLDRLSEACGWLRDDMYQDYVDDIQAALDQALEVVRLVNDQIDKRVMEEDWNHTAALLKGEPQ